MKRFLKNVLFIVFFVCVAVFVINSVYKKIGYGYFKKALSRSGVTFFTRDDTIKYGENNSYKIENKDYNNATFYKSVKLKKSTPYKVSCMVKTENVDILNKSNKNSGAKITILNSDEESEALTGTNDWREVSLMFNSQENEELNIGFMLGGDSNTGNVKGKAWFSSLKIEEGKLDESNDWNFVCFIFKETDINLFNSNYRYSMTDEDIKIIGDCMERFKESCNQLSDGKMNVTYTIIEIDTPITELNYDEDKGYYIDPENVSKSIKPYITNGNYDHIFVCTRLSDANSSIPIKNWLGLGGMEYMGRGFSNIRMPTDIKCSRYIYNEKTNRFPEEVFVHEFLHDLERIAKKFNMNVPALHDNEKYGYKEHTGEGIYDWYKAYMTKTIGESHEGLDEKIYTLKPLNEENFKEAKCLNEFEDVKNIFERLKFVVKTMNCGFSGK